MEIVKTKQSNSTKNTIYLCNRHNWDTEKQHKINGFWENLMWGYFSLEESLEIFKAIIG